MKKNAKPELTASWWNSNKPKAWDDGRLEMALQAYVKGLSRFEKEKSGEAMGVAIDLLDQVEKHVSASVKVATEKPKKPSKDYDAEDFSNTAEALKKFDSCIKEEKKRLEGLVAEESEEDEEEEDGVLLDEEAYRKYLKKKMKKIESKPCVFALALSKPSNPEEHRFLFHKTKNGKKLGMEILDEVKSLEMKKLTWGIASADPDSKSTLVLMLEHKQLPGMIKQGNKFLKAFKPLPFDTIKLLSADGKELQDLPDEEDEESAVASGNEPQTEKPDLMARLNALIGRIKDFALAADLAGKKAGADLEAKKAALEPKNRLLTLVRDCKGLIGTNDEQAEVMLNDIEDILKTNIVEPKATTSSPEKKPDLMGRLNALTSRIKEFVVAADLAATNAGEDLDAKKTVLAPKNRLLTLVRDFKGMIGKNDEQAEAMLVDIEEILNSKQVASSTSSNTPLDQWTAARNDAVAKVRAELRVILSSGDRDAGKAGKELQSVLQKLNSQVATTSDAEKMMKYVEENEVVAQIDKLAFPLKKPLLDVLGKIKGELLD